MKANADRLSKDIATLKTFSEPGKAGVHRMSFTPEYRRAVDYMKDQMLRLGMDVRENGMGVLYGTLAGSDPDAPPIVSGSHLDTVPGGGAFDGAAGAVAALEVARMLRESGRPLRHPYQAACFVEEEGATFGVGCLASAFISGERGGADLDGLVFEGRTLRETLREYGASAKDICRKGEKAKAFVELHIEQGPILENENLSIGIVESIVGAQNVAVRVTGEAGHAGTTPMKVRKNAGIAACGLILAAHAYVREKYWEDLVLTVGKITLLPGGTNVIPGEAQYRYDLRSHRVDAIKDVVAFIGRKAAEIAEEEKVAIQVTPASLRKPTWMSGHVKDLIEQSVKELGYSYKRMNSGAGHDTMKIARIWDTGMIFVPSERGLSHNPAENTKLEDLARGVDVLYGVVRRLDGE